MHRQTTKPLAGHNFSSAVAVNPELEIVAVFDYGVETRAAFVECFRESGMLATVLTASSDAEAVRALAAAQEAATPASLMAVMAGFVIPQTADHFMRDAGAS